ncbi:MAG: YebC/PmpR family DNA-binding transcriptional regulator [Candidatus Nitrohelix vancouverensis]|uniref:Probable transcriptional regulatory protein G3M78_13825 n=1 Tax=Candidatus Nitrohelix vancouverensis TaxID=2705534 RepID=A0A7T0C4N3_9BACT|nr:MAG: YebC/PmpR family DNA-binding transcriptional regulator [Candidatus Nitrohelix vancouverensis]
MSGHSKWASIKHKKGAADAKRGKIFTRIIKEITVAARLGGGDADGNPRLRTAILSAKQANMPQDNIIRAIKKGTGELEGVQYEEITYEGYGPGGVAIFIEVMTDNRNRTIGEIRSIFGKNGGNIGENGCVGWIFEQKGFFTVPAEGREEDELMELIIESGAEDLKLEGEYFEITCAVENFELVRKALEDAEIPTETAELTRIPQNTVPVEESNVKQLIRLMDGLDDHDDVQKSYANFDISDEVLATLD